MNNENNVSNNVQTPGNQTPEERNRKVLRTAGILLVIVIILAVAGNSIWKHKAAPATPAVADDGCPPGTIFSATTGKPCPALSSSSMTADAAASAGPGGYEEAIHLYAGKVVVFDADCKPIPAAPTFAVGTRILVADNSATPLTLSVAGKSKSLGAYHYFTVPLTTPGSAVVSCNGAPAATVTVQ